MPTSSDIRVSIDVGCHTHSVAIGLPSGEVLDEFDLAHRPEGFDLFFERVERCQRRYGGEVSVAIAQKGTDLFSGSADCRNITDK